MPRFSTCFTPGMFKSKPTKNKKQKEEEEEEEEEDFQKKEIRTMTCAFAIVRNNHKGCVRNQH